MDAVVSAGPLLRLLDMVAFAGAALLAGDRAVVGRGRGEFWTVVACSEGAAAGLTGRGLAGASVLPHGSRIPLLLETPEDGPIRVERCGRGGDDARLAGPVGPTPQAVGYVERGADDHYVLVVVERPTRGSAGEQQTRLAEIHRAAAAAVADAFESESRLRAGLEEREEERRRWARELHDETLQELGALQMLLTAAGRRAGVAGLDDGLHPADAELLEVISTAGRLVGDQIAGLRHLITELRPATLDDLGLQPPLRALTERTKQLTGIQVDLRVSLRYSDGDVSTRLLPDVEVAVYRVVQEALTNISRHSGASRAAVSVVELDGLVHVEVRDDGRGLPSARTVGFGVPGMRERAMLAGGNLEVFTGAEAGPDGGTVIRMRVPATHRDPEKDAPAADHQPGRPGAAGDPG